VVTGQNIIDVPSKEAQWTYNTTILNRNNTLVHTFRNPQGAKFQVFAAKTADVYKKEEAFATHTWFPGFAWSIVACPRCGFHLGWFFQPIDTSISDRSFVGLILDHLVHTDYANSLLVIPKFYHS